MNQILYTVIIILLTAVSFITANARQAEPAGPPFVTYQNSEWVDSVMKKLTPDERIAQLIMVAAYSNGTPEHKQEILKLINDQKIGGLIFFQGDPEKQVQLLNEYQAHSDVPLLVAIDAEWGLGMRLDNTISYPYQMTLGAIQGDSLIYKMGAEIARQLKHVGVHMNFAPVVDVNNNPKNPVINFRSFGEDRENVAQKGIAYMRGMQDNNIMATAKHFPGHGDTDVDSHSALPQIKHSRERLDSVELYPFRKLINAGVGGIMVAHLNIPALEPEGIPSTLSRSIVTDLLKNEYDFQGLVVTDAMNMKGVTGSNPPGVVDKDAILAGNDLLEFTEDVPRAIAEIRKAIQQGLITQKEIDDRCRKILAVKHWAGLNNYQALPTEGIEKKLNTPAAKLLKRNLMKSALTVLNNSNDIIPVKHLEKQNIASVSFGAGSETPFQETLSLYAKVNHFNVPEDASQEHIDQLKEQLKTYNLILAGVHDHSRFPRNVIKLSEAGQQFLSELSLSENVVISVFKNPYVMDKVNNIENTDGLILTYQDNVEAQELAAQLIFGGIGASGRLPVSVGDKFESGDGLDVKGGIRLGYTMPEDVGIDSEILYSRIDSLVNQAMDMKAIPGAQVLVAKDRKVVMYKSYGLHKYSDTTKVKPTDLYDLASVTKISTGLPSLMKLYDEGKFELDQTLADHLPSFKRSNKSDIPYYDILTHQGRLKPWIPFWKNTLRKNGSYKWFTIKSDSSKRFPIKLRENMFLHRKYPDRIVKVIRKSPLGEEKKYVYSDFFFILAPRVVESMIDEDFTSYINKNFYRPLGATTVTYNPFEKYSKDEIVPTEHDYYFRKEPIHGTVHDEGAIMMGGISGHAGLFANANDLAKIMQMYLDMGEYGGKQYIDKATLEKFSTTQFPENNNHRALGFDKPYIRDGEKINTAQSASPASFGHTGFTGTMVWMDPENDLLYIFLSNRVTPTRDNKRLYHLNTRTNIHQAIYDAVIEAK
ncbi:MAG: glycoside hydrolase family 3 N-terminal domain-containing protein [Candidatus Cyclobacteriaceae bacterium M2_1C_046]